MRSIIVGWPAAVRGVLANRVRATLTILGIMIGVFSVTTLIAVGNGSAAKITRDLADLGTNLITVMGVDASRYGPGGANGTISRPFDLGEADVAALEKAGAKAGIQAVVPVLSPQQSTIAFRGKSASPGEFTGTTASYQSIRNLKMSSGNFFSASDVRSRRRSLVLGNNVAAQLFGPGVDPVGAQVTVNGIGFSVAGVLARRGGSFGQSVDDSALAPITAVQDALTGRRAPFGSITVQASPSWGSVKAVASVNAVLLKSRGEMNFQAYNDQSLVDQEKSTVQSLRVLLAAVAGISLLVAGIGVMNIMLVTVTERTNEIGIRKAIGAQQGDIIGQFLSEALIVSVIGAVLGVVTALSLGRIELQGSQPVFDARTVVAGFGVAVLIGLVSGIYPAFRASRLRPVDALRYE